MEQLEKKSRKTNSSIVYKLTARLFSNMLGVFVMLNIILTVLCAVGFVYAIQTDVDEITKYLDANGGATAIEGNKRMLDTFDYEVKIEKSNKKLFTYTKNRQSFNKFISSIEINRIGILEDGTPIYVKRNIGNEIKTYLKVLLIFLGFQLIILISELFNNQKTIRRTLRPLEELARATNVLNAATDMSPDALKKLAGALDAINANHLDARIPISSAKTELKSLSMAINGMLDRIDGAYKSQMRFVSDASHELRTPIAVIEGYANLLDRWGKEDPEAMQEAINAIKSESRSMKEMVEQLLFLARGDNESMHLEIEEVNILEVAKETASELKMIDHSHRIIEDFEIASEEEELLICGDSGLIKQLIRILTDNSVKYTPVGKSIKISVKSNDNSVYIIVQDEGMGIAPEALSNIFDRFYRTDDSRARETGGTGLGLAIAKWIVDKHGGVVEVISRREIGTRITVSFNRITKDVVGDEPV